MYSTLLPKLNFQKFSTDLLKQMAQEVVLQCHTESSQENKLLMVPSLIKKTGINPEQEDILAVDFGGTNLRTGLFALSPAGNELHSRYPLKKTVLEASHYSLDGLLNTIADFIQDYLQQANSLTVNKLGLVFSFPAEIVDENGFVDVSRSGMGLDWGKGFFVDDSQVNISQALRAKLLQREILIKKMLSLNDVVALLLSDQQAQLSLIIGTGYNIGLIGQDNMVINTEVGASYQNGLIRKYLPKPAAMLIQEQEEDYLNKNRNKTGFSPRYNEVQIGGGFLYKLLFYSLCFLGCSNIELLKTIIRLESRVISLIVSEDWQTLNKEIGITLKANEQKILQEISILIIERCSDLVASQLAGAALYMKSLGKFSTEIVIAADGSVIRNVPGLKEQIAVKTGLILDPAKVEIKLVENSGLLGAAYALLNN